MYLENPHNGVLNYDNLFWAILNIFIAITLEGWSDQMYYLMDANDQHFITIIFFILLILFGSFILINLTLAVIISKFREAW